MSENSLQGGCQCGAVRYEITGAPIVAALCHCSMCRRANAAPAVAWAMYQQAQVRFLANEPALYRSSPDATRGFCARCGTQISFVASYIPGLVDITIGSMDRPDDVPPAFQYWDSKRVSWLHLAGPPESYPELPPVDRLTDNAT